MSNFIVQTLLFAETYPAAASVMLAAVIVAYAAIRSEYELRKRDTLTNSPKVAILEKEVSQLQQDNPAFLISYCCADKTLHIPNDARIRFSGTANDSNSYYIEVCRVEDLRGSYVRIISSTEALEVRPAVRNCIDVRPTP